MSMYANNCKVANKNNVVSGWLCWPLILQTKFISFRGEKFFYLLVELVIKKLKLICEQWEWFGALK